LKLSPPWCVHLGISFLKVWPPRFGQSSGLATSMTNSARTFTSFQHSHILKLLCWFYFLMIRVIHALEASAVFG